MVPRFVLPTMKQPASFGSKCIRGPMRTNPAKISWKMKDILVSYFVKKISPGLQEQTIWISALPWNVPSGTVEAPGVFSSSLYSGSAMVLCNPRSQKSEEKKCPVTFGFQLLITPEPFHLQTFHDRHGRVRKLEVLRI